MDEALDITNANGNAKGAARSAFYGAELRFFNAVLTSMSIPTVLENIKADIAAGKAVVIQLTSTGEAQQDRALTSLEEGQDLEDIDTTPRDALLGYIEKSFPTEQYMDVTDDNGNTVSVPTGTQNHQAVRMRDELLSKLASIKIPASPLEYILDELGHENVAEVTGRSKRIVYDQKTGKKILQKRGIHQASNDAEDFMNDLKQILVFSEAGGTGRSYHADKSSKNQRPRVHYLLQAGWRADKAIQGLGRTHRSNQAHPPLYHLVQTDIKGHMRFISTIARRLDQLGALTKGQRQTGSQGIFQARDNLENDYAHAALKILIDDIFANRIEGVDAVSLGNHMGLDFTDVKAALPPMTQFMNRLLALEIEEQNRIFEALSNRMDTVIQVHADAGTLDVGIETITGKTVEKKSDRVLYTDKDTGANTRYVKLAVTNDAENMNYDAAKKMYRGEGTWYINDASGRIWRASPLRDRTDKYGNVIQYRTLRGAGATSGQRVDVDDLKDTNKNWREVGADKAKEPWDAEYKELPQTITTEHHMVTGMMLPIWNRLPGSTRILRTQTNDGERILGRAVKPEELDELFRNLGATGDKINLSGMQVYDKVLKENAKIRLSNRWIIRRSLVSGDERIEIVGPDYNSRNYLINNLGLIEERIDWKNRYFIPTDKVKGSFIINDLLANNDIPVSNQHTMAPALTPENADQSVLDG